MKKEWQVKIKKVEIIKMENVVIQTGYSVRGVDSWLDTMQRRSMNWNTDLKREPKMHHGEWERWEMCNSRWEKREVQVTSHKKS